MAEANLGGDFVPAPRTIRTGNTANIGPVPTPGRIVHYVSYGTPGGEYPSVCRAAIVTEVSPESNAKGDSFVGLCVLNPTGMFFNQAVGYHDGAEQPGSLSCASVHAHGDPFRYCSCGWSEASHVGGTWHWPERA